MLSFANGWSEMSEVLYYESEMHVEGFTQNINATKSDGYFFNVDRSTDLQRQNILIFYTFEETLQRIISIKRSELCLLVFSLWNF